MQAVNTSALADACLNPTQIDEDTISYTIANVVTGEPQQIIQKLEPVDQIVPSSSGCHNCEHRHTCPALKMLKGKCRDWKLAQEIVNDRYHF